MTINRIRTVLAVLNASRATGSIGQIIPINALITSVCILAGGTIAYTGNTGSGIEIKTCIACGTARLVGASGTVGEIGCAAEALACVGDVVSSLAATAYCRLVETCACVAVRYGGYALDALTIICDIVVDTWSAVVDTAA